MRRGGAVLAVAIVLTVCWTLAGCGARRHTGPGAGPVVVAPAPKPPPPPAAGKPMPPPWAPAHGVRAKYQYRYYPDLQVYFDPVRALWFFLEAHRWVAQQVLPPRIVIGVNPYVILHMEIGEPYRHHDAVRGKYPPGKKGKPPPGQRGKGKGKNPHDG